MLVVVNVDLVVLFVLLSRLVFVRTMNRVLFVVLARFL